MLGLIFLDPLAMRHGSTNPRNSRGVSQMPVSMVPRVISSPTVISLLQNVRVSVRIILVLMVLLNDLRMGPTVRGSNT